MSVSAHCVKGLWRVFLAMKSLLWATPCRICEQVSLRRISSKMIFFQFDQAIYSGHMEMCCLNSFTFCRCCNRVLLCTLKTYVVAVKISSRSHHVQMTSSDADGQSKTCYLRCYIAMQTGRCYTWEIAR